MQTAQVDLRVGSVAVVTALLFPQVAWTSANYPASAPAFLLLPLQSVRKKGKGALKGTRAGGMHLEAQQPAGASASLGSRGAFSLSVVWLLGLWRLLLGHLPEFCSPYRSVSWARCELLCSQCGPVAYDPGMLWLLSGRSY